MRLRVLVLAAGVFIPGANKQEWELLQSKTLAYMKGSAAPKEIATKVCSIITGQEDFGRSTCHG